MSYSLFLKRKNNQQVYINLSLTIFILLVSSCGKNIRSSEKSESELINRVDDVMEQIAIQGNISEEERQAILSLASLVQNENDLGSAEDTKAAIPFVEVDVKPLYPGCDADGLEKDCFEDNVNNLLESEFDMSLIKNSDAEQKPIEFFFMINKNGKVSNSKIRESNVVVLAELARVLKLLPKMTPGTQNGAAVDVMYSGVFNYGSE